MKFIVLAIISLVLGFGACNTPPKSAPAPKDLIAEKDMVSVLKDLHLAEAAVLHQRLAGDSLTKTYRLYYKQVFAIHHITTAQFKQSLSYYAAKPEKLEKMYNTIINELNGADL